MIASPFHFENKNEEIQIIFDFSLSLPYAVGLLALQISMKYFNDFATVDIPSVDHQTCESSMWRNLFYIDQFYPLSDRVSLYVTHQTIETFSQSICLSVHDLVMDSIAGNAIFRRRQHHFVDIEESSALRFGDILFILNRIIFRNDRSSFPRSTSTTEIEFKVNRLHFSFFYSFSYTRARVGKDEMRVMNIMNTVGRRRSIVDTEYYSATSDKEIAPLYSLKFIFLLSNESNKIHSCHRTMGIVATKVD